jgi:hypothetical protein
VARTALTAFWLGLVLSSAERASAEELPDSILLHIDDCPVATLKLADAYAAARLELGQVGVGRIQVDGDERAARADLTVRMRCESGIQATLRLRPRAERSTASRVISLDDASAKDRPRVLALALAELVRSDWSELVSAAEAQSPPAGNSTPSPPAAAASAASPSGTHRVGDTRASHSSAEGHESRPADADDAERANVPDTPAQLRLRADAIVRWFTAYPGVTFGAAFGVDRSRFSAGVEGAIGRHSTERGTASYGFGAAAVGLQLLRSEWGRARFALGPKVALGGTWATGKSALSNVVVESEGQFYADARLEAAASAHFSSLEPGVRVEAGRATGIAITDRGSVIGATGGWFLGGALGLSW